MKAFVPLAVVAILLAACGEPPTQPPSVVAGRAPRSTAALTQADGTPVMRFLANPRHLAWGPEGALYVAEAGRGGTAPCFIVLSSTVCYGPTGAVSRLLPDGEQERIIDDLPSWVTTRNANGTINRTGRAQGPNGISLDSWGNAYVSIGLEADPSKRASAPELAGFGTLVRMSPTLLNEGHANAHAKRADWEFVADIGQFELDVNPDCGDLDSNPFGVLADGGKILIADAGGNAIVRSTPSGKLSTFAAFTNNTTVPGEGCPSPGTRDFVPTSIVKGPDGAYYIGHLNGLPIAAGSSTVWKMEADGAPEVYCTGFTWIIALAFDDQGNLYVLQHSDGPTTNNNGSLIRVAPDCSRTTVVTGLFRPTGVAADALGNVYVSMIVGTNFAGEGQVRRFTP